MYTFDFSTVSSTISSFFCLVGGILRFDPRAYAAVYTQDGGYAMAIAILFLGGISLGLGQSVVLFANRVRRRRFVLRLLTSGLVLLLAVFFWAGSVWLLAQIFFGGTVSILNIFIGAAISTAPLLFGFFVLLPYLGIFIFQILRIWALLIYLSVIETAMDIGYWWALLLSIAGWLLLELLIRLPALRFDRLRQWYWRVTTGTPQRLDIEESVRRFVAEVRAAAGLENEDTEGGED